MATARLAQGSRLGPYEILAPLGAGGMGEVYRARDTRLNREVAIKILSSRFAANPERRERFLHEARAASALNHPNIVALYDIGSEDGGDFLVMELVRGRTLDQLIGNVGLPISEALRIAIPIADAVACAHGAGIQHRDLKPANLMITAEGVPKVLDFGLAKLIETDAPSERDAKASSEEAETRTLAAPPLTQEGVIAGTPAYMSPEQAEGKKLDARSDIFSFGAVLYEMVTGRRAFRGGSTASTLAAVLREDPESPTRLIPLTPRQLERIIERCLRKDLNRRYQHMGDVKVALEDVLADVEAARTSSGSLPAVTPGSKARRWLWPAITAAALVIAAISWWYRGQAQPLADLALERLTGDPGLATTPAISPDGRLIAYASDRAGNGNLDIWVQHRGGGGPIRVAQEPGDKFEPSFSPDGSQIVYTGTGGIYVVPVLGGEPRRLAKGGFSAPRFSPDGKQLVFQTRNGGNATIGKIYLLDIGSEQPRMVSGDLRACNNPIWSPDGRRILFGSVPVSRTREWWLLTVSTGKTARLGPAIGPLYQWLPGDWILFSPVRPGRGALGPSEPRSLAVVKFSPWLSIMMGKPRRLTSGTDLLESPSVAGDGTLALSVGSYRSNLWSLQLDANTAKVRGEPVALTEDVGFTAYPSISADGKKLAFDSDSSGLPKVWLMDIETRRRRMLTPTATTEHRPILSPDGAKVAFFSRVDGGKSKMLVADVSSSDQPGAPRTVCDDRCYIAWDWWPDNRGFLTSFRAGPVQVANVPADGSGPVKFAASKGDLWQSHPSPDGHWLLIMDGGTLKVAPLTNGKPPGPAQWKRVVNGNTDLYRWSPDGNTVYFISTRDRFRCIWAQRLNPATKDPVGQPFAIYHAHGASLSMQALADSGAVGLAVARDKIVFAQAERTGNIWLGKLDLQ